MDWQAKRLEGNIFTVRFIDSAGQIHLEETGIALSPGVDQFGVAEKGHCGPFSFLVWLCGGVIFADARA